MNGNGKNYNFLNKRKAGNAAVLRVCVIAYLVYLGWTIAKNSLTGESPMPQWAGILLGVLFILVAAGFAVHTFKRYQADLKAAELPDSETEESPEAEGEEEPEDEQFDEEDSEEMLSEDADEESEEDYEEESEEDYET